MSREVDQKVVEMKFDNAEFERKVKTSMSTLDKLKESLKFDNVKESGSKLAGIFDKITFGKFNREVDTATTKLSGFQMVAFSLVNNIVSDFYRAGKALVANFINPLTQGGMERALNFEQARFQLQGMLKDAEKVEEVMDAANNAVTGTAYGFDEAARVASTFAASGVPIEKMESTLLGVAGSAAMTGRSFSDIGNIFSTISSNGKIMTMQLRQFSASGLDVSSVLAKSLGKTSAEINDMISKGLIDAQTFFDIMSEEFGQHAKAANDTFAGSLSNMKASVKRIGGDVAAEYIRHMRDVFNAVSPVMDALRSGLAPIIKGSNSLLSVLMAIGKNKAISMLGGIEKFIKEFSKLNGFKNIAVALANSFTALFKILEPIGAAFREIFAGPSVAGAVRFTEILKDFTAKLIITDETAGHIKMAFKGVFSVIKLVLNVLGQILTGVASLLKPVGYLLGLVGKGTVTLGGFVGELTEVVTAGKPISKVFSVIQNALSSLIGFFISAGKAIADFIDIAGILETVFGAIAGIIGGVIYGIVSFGKAITNAGKAVVNIIKGSKPGDVIKNISDNLGKMYDKIRANHPMIAGILSLLTSAFKIVGTGAIVLVATIVRVFETLARYFDMLIEKIKNGEKIEFFDFIVDKLKKVKDVALDLFGQIDLENKDQMLKNFTNTVKKFFGELTIGKIIAIAFAVSFIELISSLSHATDGLSGIFRSVSKFIDRFGKKTPILKTKAIEFAAAIAIIALSLGYIAAIPTKELLINAGILLIFSAAMMAIASALGFLTKKQSDVKPACEAMLMMSAAVLIVAKALKMLEKVDVTGIWPKIGALAAIIAGLSAIAIIMSHLSGNAAVVSSGLALLALCGVVFLIVKSLDKLKNVNLEGLQDKVYGIIAIMVGLAAVSFAMSKIKFSGALGVVLLAASMGIIVNAINKFLTIDFKTPFNQLKNHVVAAISILVGAAAMLIVLSRTLTVIGQGFLSVGEAILAAGAGLFLLSLAIKTIKKSELSKDDVATIEKFIAIVGIVLGAITILNAMGGDAQGRAIRGLAQVFASLGLAALALAVAVRILSGIDDPDSLVAATIAVGILTTLVAVLVSVSQLSEKANVKALITIMGGLAILFAEMVVLTLIPFYDVLSAAASMSAVMVALIFLLKTISSSSGLANPKKMATLIPMVGVLAAIGGSLAFIAQNNWLQILLAAGAMSLVMFALLKTLQVISKSSGLANPKKMTALIPMVAAIAAIGFSLSKIAKYNWKQIGAAGLAMTFAIGAMGGILTVLAKFGGNAANIVAAGAAMAIASVGTMAMAKALQTLEGIRIEQFFAFAAGILVLTAALIALAAVFEAVPIGAVAVVAVLGSLAATLLSFSVAAVSFGIAANMLVFAFNAFVQSLHGFEDLDMKYIGDGLVAMAPGLMALGLAGAVAALGAPGMLVMSLSLLALSTAVPNLVGVDYLSIAAGLTEIAKAGMLLDLAAPGFIAISMALFGVAAAFMAFGAAALLVGAAAGIFSVGFNSIVAALHGLDGLDLQTIGDGLVAAAPGVIAIGLAGAVAGLGAPGLLAASVALLMMGPAMHMLTGVPFESIGKGLFEVGKGCAIFMAIGFGLMAAGSGLLMMAPALLMMGPALLILQTIEIDKIATGLDAVGKSGLSLLAGAPGMFAAALAMTALTVRMMAAGTVFTAVMAAMITSYTLATGTLAKGSVKAGSDACAGLVKGVLSNIGGVVKAGIALADGFFKGFKEKTGWNSPWASLIKAGGDAIEGLKTGIATGDFSGLKNAGKAMGSAVLEGVTSELSKLGSIGNAVGSMLGGLASGADSAANSMSTASARAEQLGHSTASASEMTQGFADNVFNFDHLIEEAIPSMDELTGSLDEGALSADNFGESIGGAGGAASEAKDIFSSMSDTIKQQMDIFSEFSAKTEISGEQMLNNMRSQINGVTEWANNLQELAYRGINQGLLQQLSELGPQGYEKVAAFVQMTDAQLQEANALYAVSLQLPGAASQQVVQSYAVAGQMASQGFANGIDPSAGIANAEALGLQTLTSLQNVLEIHSPSQATKRDGIYLCMGLTRGIIAGQAEVWDRGKLLGDRLHAMIRDALTPSKFHTIGYNICTGIAAGISSGMSNAISAAVNMARSAYEAAKSALDINSPSRVFMTLGEYVDEGFAAGIDNNLGMVNTSVKSMARTSLNVMRDSLNSIRDALEMDLDTTPVIKPILDLSNLKAGFDQIDNMMGSKSTSINGVSGIQNGSSGATNYNFVQNNYSPKALSRVDIYRQTNNQFSQFKEMVGAQ